jgi:DNA-binding transcriptional regulator YiaG
VTRSAGQKLVTLMSQYSEFEPNPLTLMREDLDFTQPEMALYLGVNKNVVNCAEDGMFSLIPTCYRVKILNIMVANKGYQQFRHDKRIALWDLDDFPYHPAARQPMVALLKHFELTTHKFGSRACVQTTEVFKMCTKKRTMTSNFKEFLETVGLPNDWIAAFDRALGYNAAPAVVLRTNPGRPLEEDD